MHTITTLYTAMPAEKNGLFVYLHRPRVYRNIQRIYQSRTSMGMEAWAETRGKELHTPLYVIT